MSDTPTEPESGNRTYVLPDDGSPRDERELIRAPEMEALRFTLHHPITYVQRVVEHLSFLPSGGQRWRRDVQVRIPMVATLDEDVDYDFIVSLGMFERRRLPDFEAFDSAGRSLNLLTRFQHGHCLAESALAQYLLNPEWSSEVASAAAAVAGGNGDPRQMRLAENYQALYRALFDLFTSVESDFETVADGHLRKLLSDLGADATESEQARTLLANDLELLADVTQYLCWVRGRPGGIVRVAASYTIPDAKRLADRRKGEADRSLTERVASQASNFYTRVGLGPINYEMFTPANAHAGSYYFMVQPPAESRVGYLDWGLDNSASGTEKEWLCAHSSVHVHNGARLVDFELGSAESGDELTPAASTVENAAEEPALPSQPGYALPPAGAVSAPIHQRAREEIEDSKIYAFLRLDLSDHWQIAFGAFLNLVFVWLAESGGLVSELGGSTTPWLLFTPAALVAYVAQQSRHYYAATTGWVRLIIWGYLVVNLGFLVSISFDLAKSGSFLDRHGFRDDVASVGMAAASIGVLVLFVAMGRWHEIFVRRWFRRACTRQQEGLFWYQRIERWVRKKRVDHPRFERVVGFLKIHYHRLQARDSNLARWSKRIVVRWRRLTRKRKSVELYTKAARRWGNTVAFVGSALLLLLAVLIVTGQTPDESEHGHVENGPRPAHRALVDIYAQSVSKQP